jgi:hypothetical protein
VGFIFIEHSSHIDRSPDDELDREGLSSGLSGGVPDGGNGGNGLAPNVFDHIVLPHRIVFAGLARDNALELPRAIRRIEALGEVFEDYRVVVVENDSSDSTAKMLSIWAQSNWRVFVDCRELGEFSKRPSLSFLADLRNRYLTLLAQEAAFFGDWNLLAVLDFDLLDIDIRGVRLSVGLWLQGSLLSDAEAASISTEALAESKVPSLQFQRQPSGTGTRGGVFSGWSALAANGVTQDGRYHDVFALRAKTLLSWEPERGTLYKSKQGLALIKKTHVHYDPELTQPFGVASAFGGFAVYQRQAVEGCRYSAPNEDCEHVAFHACISHKGNKNYGGGSGGGGDDENHQIAVAPRMMVTYDLPCDPGPGVDTVTGCLEKHAVLREMKAFASRCENLGWIAGFSRGKLLRRNWA